MTTTWKPNVWKANVWKPNVWLGMNAASGGGALPLLFFTRDT